MLHTVKLRGEKDMETAKKFLDKILSTFCVILFGFMTILVVWQVFTRLILNDPSVISEELAKFMFVWVVLFGGAYVFGERGHLAVVFVKEKFHGRIRVGLEIIIELITAFFSIFVLLIGGYLASQIAWNQLSAALQIPVGYMYAAMPISAIFILFYCSYNIWDTIKNKQNYDVSK